MSSLKEKVDTIIQSNINILTSTLVEEAGDTLHNILSVLPEDMSTQIPVEDFYSLWDELVTWDKALLFVQTPGFVIDMNAALPPIIMGAGDIPTIDWGLGLDAHIMVQEMGSIWMLNKPLFERESLSIQFCHKSGREMFAVYAGRFKSNREIMPPTKESYQKLWEKYSSHPFVNHETKY